jgi:hypothetical protein
MIRLIMLNDVRPKGLGARQVHIVGVRAWRLAGLGTPGPHSAAQLTPEPNGAESTRLTSLDDAWW